MTEETQKAVEKVLKITGKRIMALAEKKGIKTIPILKMGKQELMCGKYHNYFWLMQEWLHDSVNEAIKIGREQKFREWMIKNWGKRCKEFEPGCGLCVAWKCFDFLLYPDKYDDPVKIGREQERKDSVLIDHIFPEQFDKISNENIKRVRLAIECHKKQARLSERKRVLDEIEKKFKGVRFPSGSYHLRISDKDWQSLKKKLKGDGKDEKSIR